MMPRGGLGEPRTVSPAKNRVDFGQAGANLGRWSVDRFVEHSRLETSMPCAPLSISNIARRATRLKAHNRPVPPLARRRCRSRNRRARRGTNDLSVPLAPRAAQTAQKLVRPVRGENLQPIVPQGF